MGSEFDSDDDIGEMMYNNDSPTNVSPGGIDDDKRAHHNALERKRRDHIKDSFLGLKDVVPTLHGEKASRALILKKACDYIDELVETSQSSKKDIAVLNSQNEQLKAQIDALESALNNQTACSTISQSDNSIVGKES